MSVCANKCGHAWIQLDLTFHRLVPLVVVDDDVVDDDDVLQYRRSLFCEHIDFTGDLRRRNTARI